MNMNLADRQTVQALLQKHTIRPRKHWGQNFLVSRPILNRILDAANIQKNDTLLEIGGGTGTMSVELAKRAKHVIVYERDPSLCNVLRETLAPYKNIDLRCADARKITGYQLPVTSYKLVANLPYSVGTVILRKLLESERPPSKSIVMLQKEVAKRIVAQPPHMNLLAITLQTLAEPKILFRVPARAFWPEPEVESAIFSLTTERGQTPISLEKRSQVIHVARLGFAHKRKRVLANIAKSPSEQEMLAEKCAISIHARAEELTIKQWKCLAAFAQAR